MHLASSEGTFFLCSSWRGSKGHIKSKVANTIRSEHKATQNHCWVSKSSEETGAKKGSCRKGEWCYCECFFPINSVNAELNGQTQNLAVYSLASSESKSSQMKLNCRI